jgi:nucleoside diphosphate kinase
MKLVNVEKSFAEQHYADLSSKPFFAGLVEYIISGPVVAMVWEGKSVVTTGRKIVGATNPLTAEPGTIRGDFAIDIGRSDTTIPTFPSLLLLLMCMIYIDFAPCLYTACERQPNFPMLCFFHLCKS